MEPSQRSTPQNKAENQPKHARHKNLLGIKSVEWKIEKRSLQRNGHVIILSDDRPAKRAIQGWIPPLETIDRQRKRCRNTP